MSTDNRDSDCPSCSRICLFTFHSHYLYVHIKQAFHLILPVHNARLINQGIILSLSLNSSPSHFPCFRQPGYSCAKKLNAIFVRYLVLCMAISICLMPHNLRTLEVTMKQSSSIHFTLVLCILITFFLSACAGVARMHDLQPTSDEIVTITIGQGKLFMALKQFDEIKGRDMILFKSKIECAPGPHKLLIDFADGINPASGPKMISFIAEKGHNYILGVDNMAVTFIPWIQDRASGKIVSTREDDGFSYIKAESE